MTDPYTIELLNQEIDGENTPQQSRELQDRLSADSSVRELYADLQGLQQTLASIEPVDAPLNLKRNILAALPEAKATRREKRRGLFGPPVFRLAHVFVFAAGLLLGIGGYHLTEVVGPVPNGDIVGAMTAPSIVELDTAGVQGTVRCRRVGPHVEVEFDVVAPQGAMFSLDSTGTGLTIAGFSQPGSYLDRFSADRQRIDATVDGSASFTVLLAGTTTAGANLGLDFSVSGELVYQDTLALPAE